MSTLRRDLILALVFMAAAAAYLGFISRFGVNVLFWDEWELVQRMRGFLSGDLSLFNLLGQRHTDHLVGGRCS